MLIYYTGVKNIDPVMYEAASIDGANGRDIFFHITLPLMKPVIQVNVTMAVIAALKQMETVYLLTAGVPAMRLSLWQVTYTNRRFSPINTVMEIPSV